MSRDLSLDLSGSNNVDSEELIAYEIGYRLQPVDRIYFDFAGFYNVYDNLVTTKAGLIDIRQVGLGLITQNAQFDNNADGETYGLELSTTCVVSENWQISASYSLLRMQLDIRGFTQLPALTVEQGNSARILIYPEILNLMFAKENKNFHRVKGSLFRL